MREEQPISRQDAKTPRRERIHGGSQLSEVGTNIGSGTLVALLGARPFPLPAQATP